MDRLFAQNRLFPVEWDLETFISGQWRPYLWAIVIAGITNGTLFAPASEHVYFLIYVSDGSFSVLGVVFALSNSVGHVLLFAFGRGFRNVTAKKWPFRRLANLIRDLFDASEILYSKYDPKFISVLLLRCIPFYHSAVSIMASATHISYPKFIYLTTAGNLLFFITLNVLFHLFGRDAQLNWIQVSAGLIVLSISSLILKQVFNRILKG